MAKSSKCPYQFASYYVQEVDLLIYECTKYSLNIPSNTKGNNETEREREILQLLAKPTYI